jgi:hypothetical protein
MVPVQGVSGPRLPVLAALACLVMLPAARGPAAAQTPDPDSLFRSTRGVAVVSAPGHQFDAVAIEDGAGGAFLAWVDERSGHADIYALRMGPSGRAATGWPAGGVAACRAERGQYGPRLAPDGTGGLYVAWEDLRGRMPSVFIQHFLATGERDPAWPANGMPACTADYPQFTPDLVADGTGGVIVAWEDRRGPASAIYVQRIAGDATIEVGWPTNGVPVTASSGGQYLPRLVPDDANGTLVFWEDLRTGALAAYAHRITWRGRRADSWPSGGLALSPSIGRQDLVRAIRDGDGGAFVAWRDGRRGTPDLYLTRLKGDGSAAPGWPSTGITLSTYPADKSGLRLTSDAAGGALVVWEDARSGAGSTVFGQRVDGAGHRAAGWPNDGRSFSSSAGFQVATSVVADGTGGVFAIWQDFRERQSHIYGQYLTAAGLPAAGWPAEGLRLASDASGQIAPLAASDGRGGAIVLWEQGLADPDLFASQVGASGLGAQAVTVAAAEVEQDRIVIRWRTQAGASFELIAQRQIDDAGWQDVGTRVPDAGGAIVLEDRDLRPATRYGYRLARMSANGREYMGEVWVATREAAALALAGMVPNPANADLRVSFSLPSEGPAMLELIDVSGRRMRWRDLSTLGPGRHVVDLGEGAAVPPGFYLVRLQFGDRILTARGTVIR